MELGIETTVEGTDIRKTGIVALDAKIFSDIVTQTSGQ